MKKPGPLFLLLVLLGSIIVPVHGTREIQAIVGQNIHVTVDLENIDSSLYNTVKQQALFNASTIPEAIATYFEQQNMTDAQSDYDPAQEIFDDSTNSIHMELHLTGSDILSLTMNAGTMTTIYRVRTDWRKIQVTLTNATALDLAQLFAPPVTQWNLINYTLGGKSHPAYYYNATDPSQIDPSFYIILPEEATNIQAIQDTVTFEVPLSLEESFINSPFLILTALIIVVAIAVLYRRIRK